MDGSDSSRNSYSRRGRLSILPTGSKPLAWARALHPSPARREGLRWGGSSLARELPGHVDRERRATQADLLARRAMDRMVDVPRFGIHHKHLSLAALGDAVRDLELP
jgi:hypothetical protein